MRGILFAAVLFLSLINSHVRAQTPFCGTDMWQEMLKEQNPELRETETKNNTLIYQALSSRVTPFQPQSGVYTIPVVFHIMHNNGPENVADSIIVAALEELNLRFQNAPAYFDSTGHLVNIQFCLATVDPQGNPSNGITRTVTSLTNLNSSNDDLNLKNLMRWSPDLYYNIWVVANIAGFVDGYSSLPNSAGTSVDGVVMEYIYLTNSFLLTHETGHYCGLYHTFFYTCHNMNCLLNGDLVCDTPPDTSSLGFPCMINSCSTELQDTTGFSPFTSDVNELPNYMDYTNCPYSFTQGQADRMETSVSLLRPNLFISNGCGNNQGQPPPIAGFTYTVSNCNNGNVTFSDSPAINSVTSEWDFNNDGIYETLGHNFNYTFPASGTYTVKQRVTGINGQDTLSQLVSVVKGPNFNYPIVSYPQAVTDTIRVCQGELVTFSGDTNGASFLWSTGDTTSSITFTADSSMDISLTMTDTSGFVWSTQCSPLYLLVYPFEQPIITYDDSLGYTCAGDLLTVYISNPIPGLYTWHVYYTSIGWFNTGDHNLFYNHIPDPTNGNQFYVTYVNAAGCSAVSNTLFVQPLNLPFFNNMPLTVNGFNLSLPSSPNVQYQWYNYNTPIPGANSNQYTVTQTGCYKLYGWFTQYPACDVFSDSTCFLFSDIQEDELLHEILISPNPATDEINISLTNGNINQCTVIIRNTLGEMVKNENIVFTNSKSGSGNISVSDLRAGIYLVNIKYNNKDYWKRLVITQP